MEKNIERLKLYKGDKDFAHFQVMSEIADRLEELTKQKNPLEGIKDILKGEKGDKGDPHYIPQKGKDYFTQEDIQQFLEAVTPRKGVHYRDGKDGANGRDGRDGMHGMNGKAGKDGKNGKDGYTPRKGLDYIDGKDGRDGSPDNPKDVVKKLHSLSGKDRLHAMYVQGLITEQDVVDYIKNLKGDKRIGLENIRGLEDLAKNQGKGFIKDNRMGGSGGDQNIDALTGTINGVNKIFTLPRPPRNAKEIIIFRGGNAQFSISTSNDFTLSGSTITFAVAPMVGETLVAAYKT